MTKRLWNKKFAFMVAYTVVVLVIGGFIGGFIKTAESYESCSCPGASGFYVGIERHDDVTKPDYGIFYWIDGTNSGYNIKAVYGGVGSKTITIHFSK